MFSDHNGIKLEINNCKIFGKSSNIWKLDSTVLITSVVREEDMEIREY